MSSLQWGHDWGVVERDRYQPAFGPSCRGFNGATTGESWKAWTHPARAARPSPASMGPRLGSRGKGQFSSFTVALLGASMGPRLGSRGKLHVRYWRGQVATASMGPRLGSRGKDLPPVRQDRCLEGFNGATTGESWKDPNKRRTQMQRFKLQWGHDWGVVESRVPRAPAAPVGPLQWGHDWGVVERRRL